MERETREIKFRAWDGKRMMYRRLFDRNWYTELKGGKAVFPIHPNDQNTLKVMQYTGLKDKNGKEIYEGDIIGYPPDDPSIAKVVFHKGYFGLIFNTWRKDSRPSALDDLDSSTCTILGNTFENPEIYDSLQELLKP